MTPDAKDTKDAKDGRAFSVGESHSDFAYLYERFPSYVQTFVYREAIEMARQGMAPLLVSIRRPDDPPELAEPLFSEVLYLPETAVLRSTEKLPRLVRWTVPRSMREKDVNRLYAALWLGPRLRGQGIRHVHAHFAGVAARTAWWLRKIFRIGYSFTGHANDIFCAATFPVTHEMLVRGARFVVTETDYARRWLEEKYPRARGKTFRVFNGIAMEGFPSREPAGPVPRIVSVGRYVEKKGFTVLIEACRLLHARGLVFECLIVGDGPLAADLQMQIDRAHLAGAVKLLGPQPQSEVRALLASARVFALACVPEAGGGSDNLPTVIMEAMASSLPVVSTRVAGIPEMIADGAEGFLVPPGDAPAFAEALSGLLTDPPLASRCGARARETAVEKFSIATTARALQHLLATRSSIRLPEAARRVI